VKYFPIEYDGIPELYLGYNHNNHFKFIGIIFLTLGIDIVIRKSVKNDNPQKKMNLWHIQKRTSISIRNNY
jgi:hypothetical protein